MGKSYLKRIVLWVGLWLVTALGLPTRVMAQDAEAILARARSTYESSNGVSASFTMSTRSPGQMGEERWEGTIQMRGDKFTLETPGMVTWFNGMTQWTYVERTEEVNVTNPTTEELQLTNPALLLANYQKGFKAVFLREGTTLGGKVAYDLELTPRKKSDLIKVELQIERSSHFPTKILVSAKNGVCTSIQIDQLKRGVGQPDRYFEFPIAEYPDAEVIDLR